MRRKCEEYFAADVRLLWYLDPPTASARVYSGPNDAVTLTADEELDGGDLLSGFRVRIRDWIDAAWRPPVPANDH